MRYEELGSEQKMHVNGVISKFMDNYIRNNLIYIEKQPIDFIANLQAIFY